MGSKYEAYWVFEEEIPEQENKQAVRGKPLISAYKYEGAVHISDKGINLRGKSIVTGEAFKSYILFSKILKIDKIPSKVCVCETENKKKVPEQALRIVYQEREKNGCIYIQEKLEIEEQEEEI